MRRLVPGLVACLVALPLTVLALVFVTSPASADDNGVGLTPALGWSSWSFIRHGPTAANIEAQASAMKAQRPGPRRVSSTSTWTTSGTSARAARARTWTSTAAGSPTPANSRRAGPRTASRWSPTTCTPRPEVRPVRDAGHLEAGGGPEHRRSRARPTRPTRSPTVDQENNYNCGGMVGIDYSKPGAQAFINSWADEFASWGVDYLKLDGVGSLDIPDVQAWSQALRQTGRPIHLELSNSLTIDRRLDLGAVLQRLAHRRRHRVLWLRVRRQQLPADRLGQRVVPVRPGRRVAALRRPGRLQRLRLHRGRQRQQRRAHPAPSARPS